MLIYSVFFHFNTIQQTQMANGSLVTDEVPTLYVDETEIKHDYTKVSFSNVFFV